MQSELFRTREGLRQGGVLSPTLFIVFMDDVIKTCRQKTKKIHVGYKNLQRVQSSECAFADDVIILAAYEKDLQTNTNVWNDTLKEYGMNKNKGKTKVMMTAKAPKQINIQIEGTSIEQVHQFNYLGIPIEDTGSQEREINERIDKTIKVYYGLNSSFLGKKEVSPKTKMNVYKAIYRPILTYGCETWVLSKRENSKIQATEMKYLRSVKGITRRDRIRNIQVREELEIQPILEFIEQRQLSWWVHLQRMSGKRQVREIWETRIQEVKRRGRPRETWNGVIAKNLAKRGKTWSEAKTLASNRKQWFEFVHDTDVR